MGKKLGNINEVLTTAPELNNYPIERWEQAHDFLKREGFKSEKFAYMVSQYPKLLTTPEVHLVNSLSSWRSFQFGERNTILLIEQFPELLQIQNSTDLVKKVNTIKEFVGGGSNVFKALLNSPSAVTQSLPSLNEKIDYLKTVMKVEPVEVYNSEALSSDIMMLKTRHNFLKRLGLYVPMTKKDPNEISKNPKLSQITDTSDKRFATKVCHVTLDEFETFQEIYQRELDEEAEEASSDEESYVADDDIRVEMSWEKQF